MEGQPQKRRFINPLLVWIVVIVITAKIIADRDGQMDKFRNLLFSLILILPPLVLIFLQPDLGTTIIIAVVWFVMALMGGVHLFHIGLLGLAALLTMLNSCANGVPVVNIDNGYGAGYAASMINRIANQSALDSKQPRLS